MVANATLCINKDKALYNELLNKASKEGKVLFRRVEANGDVKYEKHPEDKINEKENDGFEVLCSCNGLYPSGDGGGSSGGGGGGGAGGAGPSEFCIPVNGACSNNPSEGRVCCSDPVELFCINTIVQSFKCLPKDDTDAILDANRVIREAHKDVCKSASDCLEKAQAALERVKLEGSEHGENMLFNETIHQAEDAVVEAMAANHTACDLWDNALCNELLNKASKEGKVLFRRVEANGDVNYEKHPEDKIVEKTADGFSVLYTCDSL